LEVSRHIATPVLLLLLALATVAASAQETVRIGEPSYLDRQYMARQREQVEELAAERLGRAFTGERDRDLGTLQLMLDRGLVRNDQTELLQAMGVIMGDLLAAELAMHWVIYEDGLGRSRALRYRDTENYLFPITMISRRREAGNLTPVADIYRKAFDIIAPLRTPGPYQ